MKNIQSILVLVLVVISGYARSQCPTVRFSSTSTAWPTVNALPGNPQRLCLQQNIGSAGPNTTVFISPSSALAGTVSWQPLGAGITLSGQSNTQCTFSLNNGVAPLDYGKIRIVVRWGTTCGCVDTLDIFRVMNPQANASSFATIQGPGCLSIGSKGSYYVDPRFTRPANLNLGIGINNYVWTVLNDNTAGVGDWLNGPLTTPLLVASGDNSAIEIQAPATGWTNTTATLQVVQGSTCNTFQTPISISKGNPSAVITLPATPTNYTLVSTTPTKVYRLPTANNNQIQLIAPAGAVVDYQWSVDNNFTFALTGARKETCTVSPSYNLSVGGAQSGRITLTSPGCSGGLGSSDFVEIQRTLVSPTNTISQPATCQTNNTNINLSVSGAPGGGPNNYFWSFSPASALWSITAGQGTSSITAVAQLNAPPVTFQVALNGQTTPLLAAAKIGVNGNQGYTFTMSPSYGFGANQIRCDVFADATNFGVPLSDCIEANLFFDWTYTGGTNGNLTTVDGCGSSSANISRAGAGAFGGGTLSLTITQANPITPFTACASCSLTCLNVSGSTSVGPKARPAIIGSGNIESKTVLTSKINKLSVFPNPANEEITFAVNSFNEDDFIEIFDGSGRLVKTGKPVSKMTKLDIKNLKSGNYIIRYHGLDDVLSQKFLIK